MPAPSRYHAFLLRLWREAGISWRYSLEDSQTGARRGFGSLDGLRAFLETVTDSNGDTMTNSPISPVVLAAGEGQLFNALGVSLLVKTSSAQSEGQWFVLEYTAPPNFSGPPPHYHKVMTEIFYVLEGRLTFRVGEQTREVGPGGYAFVPPGAMHGFSNPTDAPAKYLGIVTPAILEQYFHEMVALVAQEPQWPPKDMGKIIALMEKYDTFAPEANSPLNVKGSSLQ